jgi:hypothetical protein
MRWLVVFLALCAASLGAAGAAAETAAKPRPFRLSDYPLEVRKTLSVGPSTCREVAGGGAVGFAPDTVHKVDFNGDGRPDYIVSFENTTCGGKKTGGFCGSGGCMVDFLVTLPNGRLRSVFVEQVYGYEVLKGRPRKVRFFIFHNYCGDRPDSDGGCFRDIRIGYRQFSPLY